MDLDGRILALADGGDETTSYCLLDINLQDIGVVTQERLQVTCMVVVKRDKGVLLAMPADSLNGDTLALGVLAGPDELIGPSVQLDDMTTVVLEKETALAQSVAPTGEICSVRLVDFNAQVAPFLMPISTMTELSGEVLLFSEDVNVVPSSAELLQEAMQWVKDPGVGDRVAYYSAEEAEPPQEVPSPPFSPAATARPKPGGGIASAKQRSPVAPKKRATVASLAESVDSITSVLPMISQQLQALTTRTEAMEGVLRNPPSRQSILAEPIGRSPMPGSSIPKSSPSALIREMPPPKSSQQRVASGVLSPPLAHLEVKELEQELGAPQDLAKAFLAQSQVLTTLVGHLASGSSEIDLSSASSASGVKGASTRMKLQAELAAQRGTFFQSVMKSMSRRMHPALPADLPIPQLAARGVVPSAYLERYGGYGRVRDIGNIAWQVALLLDHLQNENLPAAQDAAALLFVCLEQTALDNGKMDIGLMLALTEDPPSGVFSNRSIATSTMPRTFAPTADQRWITCALAYLRELDLITSRRLEATGAKSAKPQKEEGDSSSKQKPKQKGRGKGKRAQSTEEDDNQ